MGTTADKLTYLNTTKGKLKDTINYTGAGIDGDTTFRNYPKKLYESYIDILTSGTDTLYNNIPKVSGTGTSITLNGTTETKMKLSLATSETNQSGTPTPSSPQAVHTISGNNTIKVEGKNLALPTGGFGATNVSRTLENQITTFNGSYGSAYSVAIYLNNKTDLVLKANKTYVFSFISTGKCTSTGYKYIYFKNINIGPIPTNGGTVSYTYTPTQDLVLNQVALDLSANTSFENYSIKIQVEEGESATSYEPYISQTANINLGAIELCKMGNFEDYIYKLNGVWYKYSAIKKHLIQTNITQLAIEENGCRVKNSVGVPNITYPNIISTHFVRANDYNEAVGGIANSLNINLSGQVLCNVSGYTTTNQYLNFFTDNNVYIYFPLGTPTTTEITDATLIEQLNSLSNIYSYEGQTNISQTNADLPFVITATGFKAYENI